VIIIDSAVTPEFVARLKSYQRVSQFPGILALANKAKMSRKLKKMRKIYPEDYDFFPQTYILPSEFNEFRKAFGEKRNNVYIVKPEAMCQGKGIFLVKDPAEIEAKEHVVAQEYLNEPYLIDGLKFDLRIYVLLTGVNPLRIYIFDEGIARFATSPY
jgi:tubulin polyglutamylase TTLL6/13